jgi:hypothetical protein
MAKDKLRCRLVSPKYQRAIAGLVMARTTSEWRLDIRDHDFDDSALHRALLGSSSLVSLNRLTLMDDANLNISQSLQRDRSQIFFVGSRN